MLDPYSEPVPFNRLWLRLQVKSTDSPIPHPHILGCIGRQVAPPRWSCQNPVHSRHWLRIPLYTKKKNECQLSIAQKTIQFELASHWCRGLCTRFSLVQRNANSLLICAENRELPSHWYKNCEPASHWCIGLHTCFSLVQRTTSSLLISAENCKLASHRCRGLQAPSHWCISAEDYTSSLLIGAEGYKLASHWWRKLRARFSLVQRITLLVCGYPVTCLILTAGSQRSSEVKGRQDTKGSPSYGRKKHNKQLWSAS